MDDDADGEAEEAVDLAHPLGVALGQIVVDRDDVDAAAGERVEVAGKRGDEGLAFAGLHLGDLAGVQDDAADELDVEVAHADGALAGLTDDGEGLGQDGVERLLFGGVDARLEVVGHFKGWACGRGPIRPARPRRHRGSAGGIRPSCRGVARRKAPRSQARAR